jgi:hypothetical protein
LTLHGYKCSDDAVHREQCDKVIQMYETMIVRCVPSCGGAFTLSMGLVSHTRCRGWSLVQI